MKIITPLVLACVVLTTTRALAAETYSGNVVDVIDSVAAQAGDIAIGIDPAIIGSLLRIDTKLVIHDDWRADLDAGLEIHGLTTMKLRGNPNIFICKTSVLDFYKGTRAIGAGKLDDAAEFMASALERAPDDPQLLAVNALLKHLQEDLPRVEKARDKLSEKLGSSFEPSAAMSDYKTAWGRMWKNFWDDYQDALLTGLTTEMYPVIAFISRELKAFSKVIGVVDRKTGGHATEQVEAVKELYRSLDDSAAWINAGVKKAEVLVKRAGELDWQQNRDDVYRLVSEAYELDPGSLKARAYLSFLRARMRLTRKQERRQLVAETYKPPETFELRRQLKSLIAEFEARRDSRSSEILLALVERKDFPATVDDGTLTSLRRLTTIVRDEPPVGEVTGLVTRGGEFAGGELFPISVTLNARKDTTRYHELVINELSGELDRAMRVSIVQALSWLDSKADNILQNYRVTLHFKDLESAKGGDSLGAAIAVAAFSALYELPPQSGVTMTGSLRAYGGVAAVGGIWAKTDAAVAGNCDLLILPADNAEELFLVPPEQSSRLRIILADDIETYLHHAFGGRGNGKTARWQESDSLYRLGYCYYRLGLLEEAHGVLARVLSTTPDDYSSRTAVELFRDRRIQETWPPAADALPAISGETAEPAVISDGTEPAAAARLQRVAQAAAVRATNLTAAGDETAAPARLTDFALLIDPEQRDALLLKAKLMKDLPVAESKLPSLSDQDFADLLISQAKRYVDQTDELSVAAGNLYYALIIDCIDQQHEEALIACAARNVQSFDAALAAIRAKLAAPATQQAAALVPKSVPKPDLSSIAPGYGAVWGAFGKSAIEAADAEGGGFESDGAQEAGSESQPAERQAVDDAPPSVQLGGVVENLKVCKSGQIIVCKLVNESRLVLVSVGGGKLIGKLRIPNSEALYACGGDVIVVFDRIDQSFHKYSATSGAKVKTKSLGLSGVVTALEMGADNSRLAMLRIAAGTGALDSVQYFTMDTNRLELTKVDGRPRNGCYRDLEHMRLAPDGKAMTAWCSSHSPSGIIYSFIAPGSVKMSYEHSSIGFILPLAGSPYAVSGTGAVINTNCQIVKTIGQPLIPDVSGRFILAVMDGGRFDFYSPRNLEQTGSISFNGLAQLPLREARWSRGTQTAPDLTWERSVVAVSDLKTIALLGPSKSEIFFLRYH